MNRPSEVHDKLCRVSTSLSLDLAENNGYKNDYMIEGGVGGGVGRMGTCALVL